MVECLMLIKLTLGFCESCLRDLGLSGNSGSLLAIVPMDSGVLSTLIYSTHTNQATINEIALVF